MPSQPGVPRHTQDPSVKNELDGTVNGSVLQVGAVHGNILIHEQPRQAVIPHQLPAGNPNFAGRVGELTRLDEAIAKEATGGSIRTIVIDGLGGVGKTSLATQWAHHVIDSFPDGQLYLNLRGFDPGIAPLAPQDAINDLLDALGTTRDSMPATYTAQEALYRSIISGRKLLLILDNVRSIDQVRPLIPASSASLVVITSRNELPGLISQLGAVHLKLQPLQYDECRELLEKGIGRHRIEADLGATAAIIRSCSNLPLAVAIVAAQAALRPSFPLAAIATEIEEASPLDYLDLGDSSSSVRQVLSWSYASLSDDAARILRRLGECSGPDVALRAIGNLVSGSPTRARPLVNELVRSNLLDEYRPSRYRMHDLVKLVAKEFALRQADDDQQRTLQKFIDHYFRTSVNADRILDPPRRMIALPAAEPTASFVEIVNSADALSWFDEEFRNLPSISRLAFERGMYDHCWGLAWASNTYFYWRSQWNEIVEMHRMAVASARNLGDDVAQTKALRGLGRALARVDLFDEAHRCHLQVLEICERLNDKVGQATTHHALSFMFDKQGIYQSALAHASLALPLWESVENPAREARALNDLGWANFRANRPSPALQFCQRALAAFERLDNKHGQTLALQNLARISIEIGAVDQASGYIRRQIALETELGNRMPRAVALDLLGDILLLQEQDAAAIAVWADALDILATEGGRFADKVRTKIQQTLEGSQ